MPDAFAAHTGRDRPPRSRGAHAVVDREPLADKGTTMSRKPPWLKNQWFEVLSNAEGGNREMGTHRLVGKYKTREKAEAVAAECRKTLVDAWVVECNSVAGGLLGLDLDTSSDGRPCVVMPGYVADYMGTQDVAYPLAETHEEAAGDYVDEGEWGDVAGVTETGYWEINVWREGLVVDDDVDVEDCRCDEATVTVTRDPEVPECGAAASGEHRWISPVELVGGIAGNPGVWAGHGASIRSVHVCAYCGMASILITSRQGCETAHDHDRSYYTTDISDGAVSVERLADYYATRGALPEGLRSDSLLAFGEGRCDWCLLSERPDHSSDCGCLDCRICFPAVIRQLEAERDEGRRLLCLWCDTATYVCTLREREQLRAETCSHLAGTVSPGEPPPDFDSVEERESAEAAFAHPTPESEE